MHWILFSFMAAIFFSFRLIIIKKYLQKVDILLITFISRFFGLIVLIPFLLINNLKTFNANLFWLIIILTSLLTGVASILQIFTVKKYELSSSIPFLSFVPLFMIISVLIFFKEIPKSFSFFGIILLSIGTFIINFDKNIHLKQNIKNIFKNKGSLIFLLIAGIYGLTTTLDRFAIDNARAGGFTYTFYWNLFSVGLFSLIFFNVKKVKIYILQIKNNFIWLIIQSSFGLIAFLSQMYAVEYAKNINANVIYVKAITLFQILIAVILGLILFKEKNAFYKLIASLIMVFGAVIIILNY